MFLPGMIVLDATITYDRSIGTRLSCRKRQGLYIFGPAGGGYDNGSPAGSCEFENGDSTGQFSGFYLRVSKPNPVCHGDLTHE